ncbi:hypothetical protein MMC09_003367 [Bachmanniomyces sp. S44760]|nr:hypothetical protein [Bachmanniomyces sp. S44760]
MTDDENEKCLQHLNDKSSLGLYFFKRFTPENFTQVFYWLHKVLDVKTSSVNGTKFMKNAYANLMAATVLHVRWELNGKCGDKNNHKAFLKSFNNLAVNEKFDKISLKDFARHTLKTRLPAPINAKTPVKKP